MIIGIIAVANNYAIGKDGTLPWHYPDDLKFFRHTTTGNAIVMGLNTWHSIAKPLPGRLSIVLSRSAKLSSQPRLLLMRSEEEVVALEKFLKGDMYVIGGAKTYASLSSIIDQWIVTEIPEDVSGADVFMEPDFLSEFRFDRSITLDSGLIVKYYIRQAKILPHGTE